LSIDPDATKSIGQYKAETNNRAEQTTGNIKK
jgi:hypothetical protein